MIEPEMAFCELQDDMQCAEDYVRFCCKSILRTCRYVFAKVSLTFSLLEILYVGSITSPKVVIQPQKCERIGILQGITHYTETQYISYLVCDISAMRASSIIDNCVCLMNRILF